MKQNSKSKEQWLKEAIENYNKKQYKEALLACEHAISIDDKWARAYHGKGLMLKEQGRYTEALKAYQKAVQLGSENTKLYTDMADLFYIMHKYEEYLSYICKAISIDVKCRESYDRNLQHLIEDIKLLFAIHFDRAIALSDKILSSNLNNMDIIETLENLRNYYTEVENEKRLAMKNEERIRIENNTRYVNEQIAAHTVALNAAAEDRHRERMYNNEWGDIGRIHPANCRCAECVEY